MRKVKGETQGRMDISMLNSIVVHKSLTVGMKQCCFEWEPSKQHMKATKSAATEHNEAIAAKSKD